MRVILIGFMGAGKTTVGKKLSESLGLCFVDLDERIENETKKKIKDIFAEDGEESFRKIETENLRKVLESQDDFVLSTGGGIVTREENKLLLSHEKNIIYLKAALDTLFLRLKEDENRPLLQAEDRREKMRELFEKRKEKYEAFAGFSIETDGKSISTIVEQCSSFIFSPDRKE